MNISDSNGNKNNVSSQYDYRASPFKVIQNLKRNRNITPEISFRSNESNSMFIKKM